MIEEIKNGEVVLESDSFEAFNMEFQLPIIDSDFLEVIEEGECLDVYGLSGEPFSGYIFEVHKGT